MEMRHKERQITDKQELWQMLQKASHLRLALCDQGKPYIVAMNYGLDQESDSLYLHCALKGRKMDILAQNNHVCFQVEEVAELIDGGKRACKWSMRYKSLVGFGLARVLTDPDEKQKGLSVIMAHYTDKTLEFDDSPVEATAVIKIEITEMAGKKANLE